MFNRREFPFLVIGLIQPKKAERECPRMRPPGTRMDANGFSHQRGPSISRGTDLATTRSCQDRLPRNKPRRSVIDVAWGRRPWMALVVLRTPIRAHSRHSRLILSSGLKTVSRFPFSFSAVHPCSSVNSIFLSVYVPGQKLAAVALRDEPKKADSTSDGQRWTAIRRKGQGLGSSRFRLQQNREVPRG